MKLTGKTVLIAGATSGLGLVTAQHLSAGGANVVVLGRRGALARDIAAGLDNAIGVEADIADADAVAAAVHATLERFGALHININTAGLIDTVPVVTAEGRPTPLGEFERLVRTNLVGTFNVMSQSVAAMLLNAPDEDGERGVVINTSSDAAYDGGAGMTGYAGTKAGINGFTLPASRDLAGKGIRVNAIVGGGFDTPILEGFTTSDALDAATKQFPNPQRLGRPEEFARFAAHIVDNGYINSAMLRIDAGYRIQL